ncbi:MAG: beta-ureidopropionase / N-carbamoyl-L-amino-acid hydrolase [Chloroflexota bacterium]|nr:beta-ureidopropionase / N-carbamoyl-L-amino-acid hydrolase [Chloroflexota bacterium]
MSDINGERLLADLRTLSTIGGQADGGVDRLAWSEADLAARRWFAERIREAGLEPRVDAALNVFGHVPGSAGPRLLTGSHLDSVPNGGRLDGAYGAVAGLEVLRTMHESGDPVAARVEVVGFADEEGVRFGTGLIGSLALTGELDLTRIRQESDWQGVPIRQVIASAGREVDRMLDAQQHLHSIAAFLELHIEQGPRMEADGVDLAVVTGIVGVYREQVRVLGRQNHAGSTPFRLRHDAGRAAARAAAGLRELVEGIDPEAVANIGVMRFDPGGVNVIPGRATFTLEVRHLEEPVVRRIVDTFKKKLEIICAAEGCRAETEKLSWVPPARMNAEQMELLEAACRELGRTPARLWSGAGHDAAILSRHVPTGMLFVPSIGGVSHSPLENTSDEHLVLGARTLLRGVRAAAARIK